MDVCIETSIYRYTLYFPRIFSYKQSDRFFFLSSKFPGEEMVGQDDFEFAYDKQTIGVDLKSRVRDMEDLKITAFHEAGHTLVSIYTKDTSPIHKVTIVAKVCTCLL